MRQQFTVVNNFSSHLADVTSGVPQGSVLGPLLFLIYINDLPLNISSRIRLFADDCIIYRTITSLNDHLSLQNDLNIIYNWCNTWQMSLNLSKCKVMSFSRKHDNSDFLYSINHSAVSQAASYKYLGVHLTPNLSWSTHISAICAKASKSLGYLRRNLRCAPALVRKHAYLTFIRSQLEFASAIWSPHQNYLIVQLESIQNRAARFITRKYDRHLSVTQIKQELSLQPLDTRRTIALLCLFHKYIVRVTPNPLPLNAPVRTSRRLHNSHSFTRIFGKTLAFNSSALPRAIMHWNDLPDQIASILSQDGFSDNLHRHFSSNCVMMNC